MTANEYLQRLLAAVCYSRSGMQDGGTSSFSTRRGVERHPSPAVNQSPPPAEERRDGKKERGSQCRTEVGQATLGKRKRPNKGPGDHEETDIQSPRASSWAHGPWRLEMPT
jgi:hypothetical protein